MPAKGQIVAPAHERFMSKINIETSTGCWIWSGATESRFGYGKFRLNGRSINSHRAAWELFVGAIPNGMFVCHKCDVPACVNPSHLFIGSSDDNNKDRAAKGRTVSPRGVLNHHAKLSEDDVRAIRKLRSHGMTGTEIAEQFPVHHCAVYDILNNKTWRHVE